MEGKADLMVFDSYVGISNRINLLSHYVKLFDEQQTFAVKPNKELQSVVAVINGKLNTSVDREEGLHLLKAFLPQCSDEIFIDNYLFWMQQCVKGLENSAVSHEVLGNLLHCSGKIAELTKSVTTSIVGKVIENLSKVNPEVTVSYLECLEVLMRNYGPSCGSHRARLEQFLFSFADSQDSLEVETAARCISVTALIGGGGTSGKNHKAAWKLLQEKLISEVHRTMDILFEDVPEGEVFQRFVCVDRCGLPALQQTNPVKKIHQLSARIINLLKFLEAMLLHELPVAKIIQPRLFINMIGRGVSVNGNVISKLVMERILLSCSLPGIHIAVLRLLNALILCCGSNLLGFGYIICHLLLGTLNWTEVAKDWPYGASKPFAQLRIEACHTLVSWLKIARGGSCLELCSDEQLVLQLLSDIRAKKPSISLSIDNGGTVGGNQKWKQLQRSSGQVASKVLWNQHKIINPSANSDLCSAAISALQWVFQVAGLFLNPTLHKMVQETVVQLLFEIIRASTCKELPVPYSSATCRLQLYGLLFTLSTQPHPAWPAPVQYALQFFKLGQNDEDIQVSGFCLQSLGTLVRLMHPLASSLQFPVVYKDTEKTPEFQESENSLRSLVSSKFEKRTNGDLTENVCELMDEDSSDIEMENSSVVLDSPQGENEVLVTNTGSHSVSPIKSLSDSDTGPSKSVTIIINNDTISSELSSSNDSEVIEVEESINSNSNVEEVLDKPSNIKLGSTHNVIVQELSLRKDSTEIQNPSVCEEILNDGVEESLNTLIDLKSSEDVSAVKVNDTVVGDSEQVIQVPSSKDDDKLKTTDLNGKQNVDMCVNIQTDLEDDSNTKLIEIDHITPCEVNSNKVNESSNKISPRKEHTSSLVTLERRENQQEDTDGPKSETCVIVQCDKINAFTSNDKPAKKKAKSELQTEVHGMSNEVTEESIDLTTSNDELEKNKPGAIMETKVVEMNKKDEKIPEDSNDEPVKKKVKIDTEAEEPAIKDQQSGKLLDDEYNDLISSFKDSVVDE